MGEFLGSSQTAAYMTCPRLGGSGTPTFLPSITIAEPACKPYDTYPAPTPLRRSLTTLPWRPSAYYGSSRLDPNVPNVGSMPEPRSDRNKLTELDSLKVWTSFIYDRVFLVCSLADRTNGRVLVPYNVSSVVCSLSCHSFILSFSVCSLFRFFRFFFIYSLIHSFVLY